jgi:hypothetical protein
MRRIGLALFFVVCAGLAAAEDLPLWIRAAVDTEIPDLSPETEAVICLDSADTSVNQQGTIRTVRRRVIRVMRESGRDFASQLALASGFDTKIRSMTAWNAPPGGKTEKVTTKRVIESQMFADTLYTDAKIKILPVPGVEVGSIVGFEWEEEREPLSLEDIFEFQGTHPVLKARYSVALPPGWERDLHWVNWDPGETRPGRTGPKLPDESWEIDHIPALIGEPSRAEDHALAGRLVVRFRPSGEDGRCFAAWEDMGAWYESLSRDALVVTRELSAKTSELTAEAPDTWSKMLALADFVQREIRYVSIQIGVGGFKPHPASSVLYNRFGDCKDKSALMSALLKALGVQSHFLIIHSDRGSVTLDSPVSLYSFNHAILAIRLPEDVPDTDRAAFVRHPRLGRLLIFDPTFPYAPLGRLPYYLQGNVGLLVSDGGGELLQTPLPAPESNLLERHGRFSLNAEGALSGEVRETRRGILADDFRYALLNSDLSQRTQFLETFLANFVSGFTILESRVENLEDHHNDLVISYRFEAPRYAKAMGDLLIVRPRIIGTKGERLEGREAGPRVHPIALRSTALHRDEFVIDLPEGYRPEELPPAVDLNAGFAAYCSRTESAASTLVYRREYRLLRPFLPASVHGEAVMFYREMDRDERQNALLKKQSWQGGFDENPSTAVEGSPRPCDLALRYFRLLRTGGVAADHGGGKGYDGLPPATGRRSHLSPARRD